MQDDKNDGNDKEDQDVAVVLILSNAPDREVAERIAGVLVEARLAACVNILAPVESVYRWRGTVERAREIPLFIKTTAACYRAVEEALRLHHPYEVPEILVLPVSQGLPAYLRWVAEETAEPSDSQWA